MARRKVNIRKGWIKIEAFDDRWGDVILRPVSQKHCEAYMQHMYGIGTKSDDCSVFTRLEDVAPYMPKAKLRDLQNGWGVVFLMDPWVFGHLLGYDAHEVRLS
jgi:hypothetical protein